MKKHLLLTIAFLTLGTSVYSQTVAGQFLNNVKNFLERRELNGIDTNYIGVPDKKWSVFANTYLSQLDFDLRSNAESDKVVLGQELGRVKVDINSKVETQVSLGLYYMGYGLSYSQDLNKGFKKNWSFTMYSSPVGGEFRYHTTDRIHGKLAAKGLGLEFNIVEGEAKMENFIVNAYYVFNPKKFSYDAAMSYSKIQKKSAGSILGGATFNQTRITAYDQVLRSMIGGVNKIYLRQFSFGAGYGYNWVPAKGLNVHLSAIPMLLITTKSATKNTGDDWNDKQKDTQKKLFGSKTHVSYTHMGRFSLSYCLSDRYMAGFSAFYNYFRVGKHSSYYASTEDWNMRFFIAVRF
ncbi:MAG: DUF4421 family protein [Bacteroidales bacterium]|nr:DUF4421 family protein [Bacteroidales bacterium]